MSRFGTIIIGNAIMLMNNKGISSLKLAEIAVAILLVLPSVAMSTEANQDLLRSLPGWSQWLKIDAFKSALERGADPNLSVCFSRYVDKRYVLKTEETLCVDADGRKEEPENVVAMLALSSALRSRKAVWIDLAVEHGGKFKPSKRLNGNYLFYALVEQISTLSPDKTWVTDSTEDDQNFIDALLRAGYVISKEEVALLAERSENRKNKTLADALAYIGTKKEFSSTANYAVSQARMEHRKRTSERVSKTLDYLKRPDAAEREVHDHFTRNCSDNRPEDEDQLVSLCKEIADIIPKRNKLDAENKKRQEDEKEAARLQKLALETAERRKSEEAKKREVSMIRVFREKLTVEGETNCGPVLEFKKTLIKVYSPVSNYGNEHWIRRDEVFPPGYGCRFLNGRYVPPAPQNF